MGFLKDFGAGLKRQLTTLNLTYLGGHPDLPNKIAVGIGTEQEYLVLYNGPTFKPVLKVPKSSIKKVELQRESSRSVGKAAAGVIVGGVLTGGIGAVAGAALGGRKKDDSLLVVTIDYNGMDIEMIFSGDNVAGKYSQFMGLLK